MGPINPKLRQILKVGNSVRDSPVSMPAALNSEDTQMNKISNAFRELSPKTIAAYFQEIQCCQIPDTFCEKYRYSQRIQTSRKLERKLHFRYSPSRSPVAGNSGLITAIYRVCIVLEPFMQKFAI